MSIASRASWLVLTTIAGLSIIPAASAQQPPATRGGDVSLYLPADFADNAPANAWDMLSRLPGFVTVDADEDVRGYAGARGNVLIDGARPTSKHEDAKTLLKRIPASAVERIELIRGGVPGIDMSGYALLANVVRRHEATSQSAIEAGLLAATDGWLAPQGQWEYGRRWDGHALDLALKLDPELDDDSGRGHIDTFSPGGARQQRERLDTRTIKNKGEASASWRQPLAGGQLSLTAAGRGERARTDTRIDALAPDAGSERVHETEDTNEAETGARYVREFGERTRLELMATRHQGWLDDREHSREDGDDETFAENTRTGDVTRLVPGDAVADGHCVGIALDAIAYEQNGNVQWIDVGQNLLGSIVAAPPPTTAPAGSTTVPSTGTSGSGTTASDPALSSIEQRLRERRMRTQRNSK